MATETTARPEPPPPDTPDEGDYDAFCTALSASVRGRAFLAEYARRNRNADTEQLLASIGKLQTSMAGDTAPVATDPIKAQLRVLLDEIGAAQNELETSIVAIKAAKLAELVALVERRITTIMAPAHAESTPPVEVTEPGLSDEPGEAVERARLAVVPTPEQPELPIPSPAAMQLPSITLVHSETIIAEVAFVEPLPAPPAQDVKPASVTIEMPTIEPAISAPVQVTAIAKPAAKAAKPANPLASIMALSEEERLALFT
jgi:hypothetical protein